MVEKIKQTAIWVGFILLTIPYVLGLVMVDIGETIVDWCHAYERRFLR